MKRGRNQRRRQGVNSNRALDSNGPDVRIRGTANQIYDKYLTLARDAASSGDRVKAENYMQHAEHYFRVIRSQQPAQPVQSEQNGEVDDDQPQVGENNNRPQRNRQREERSAQGDDETAVSDASSETANEAGGDEPVANGRAKAEDSADASDDDGETRKPRRRRTRRVAKADDAEEETKTKTVTEAAAS